MARERRVYSAAERNELWERWRRGETAGPLSPHIAEELWSIAGSTVLVSDAGWPTLSRPARADHIRNAVFQS